MLSINLDHEAALLAQTIVNSWRSASPEGDPSLLENLLRRALGVLQENGPTAAILYLSTRGEREKRTAGGIRENLIALARKVKDVDPGSRPMDQIRYLTDHVTQDLRILLLVKNLWEQSLIYARYAAASLS